MNGARYTVIGDWGSTRLRLFRVVDGAIVDRIDGPGINTLTLPPTQALLAALAPWRAAGDPERVLLCGTAGAAAIGLVEAPYAPCPCDAKGWRGRSAQTTVGGIEVVVAAGLACVRSDGTPDVMRGEETQIFGALRLHPPLAQGAQRLVLPGTHGKWAHVHDGRVLDFQTFPSGELFALLRDQSSLTRVGDDGSGEAEGFEAGLARAHGRSGLLGHLFVARSAQLREGRTHGWALGYLSGLIIGSEVAEALADGAAAPAITVIGDPNLVARYRRALERRGASAAQLDGDACAIAGLEWFAEALA